MPPVLRCLAEREDKGMAQSEPQSASDRNRRRRPVLLYDGDCGFCAGWVDRWKRSVGEAVRFQAFQDAADDFPHIALEDLRRASHLVDSDGSIHRGARAIFGALDRAPGGSLWLTAYQRVPGFAPLSEAVYRFVARHRAVAMALQRVIWGRLPERRAPLQRAAIVGALAAFVWLLAIVLSPGSFAAPRQGPALRFGSPPKADHHEIALASRAMLLLTGMAIGAALLAWRRSRSSDRRAHQVALRESARRTLAAATMTIELIDALRELATVPKSDVRFPICLAEVLSLRERRQSLIEKRRKAEAQDSHGEGRTEAASAHRAVIEMTAAEIIRWVRASEEDWNWRREELLRSVRRGSRGARFGNGSPEPHTSARAARMMRVACAELCRRRATEPRHKQTEISEIDPTPSGAFASVRV